MKILKNPFIKLFCLLIFIVFLIALLLKRGGGTAPAINSMSLRHQGQDFIGDNFSEHLNALTQRLRLVIEDNQRIKDSHQELLLSIEASKKTTQHSLIDSRVHQQLLQLNERIEKFEQELVNVNQKIDHPAILPRVSLNSDGILYPEENVHQPLLLQDSFEVIRDLSGSESQNLKLNQASIINPSYTLPSGSTLASATTMSALIGRVPVDGSIKSPYPFKIILGKENLIANGLVLPDLSGAIVQGYSVGDMTLSCVRGVVTELTFLFPDGTIVNTHIENDSIERLDQALGYLSEPDGNPCLSGAFYSNAATFLSGEIALGALSGAAKGMQFAQQGSQSNAYGSERYFNGNLAQLAMGSATEDGSSRVQSWWAARQKDSFDVVYVPPGQPVVINITQNIQIDHDQSARKLKYEDKKTY